MQQFVLIFVSDELHKCNVSGSDEPRRGDGIKRGGRSSR